MIRIKSTYLKIKNDSVLKQEYEELWEKPFDEDLEIIHFFEIFDRVHLEDYIDRPKEKLKQALKLIPESALISSENVRWSSSFFIPFFRLSRRATYPLIFELQV